MQESQFDNLLILPSSDSDQQDSPIQEIPSQIGQLISSEWPDLSPLAVIKQTSNSTIVRCCKGEQKCIVKIGPSTYKQAEIVAKFPHPQLVSIFGYSSNSLSMPQYDGTLRRLIEKSYPVSLEASVVFGMIKDVTKGLLHLHESGIVHGDLTPDNIFYRQEGLQLEFYLGDLGNSFNCENVPLVSTQTLPYRAPEPVKFSDLLDSWSLGCIIFECITGNSLIPLETSQQDFEEAIEFYCSATQINLNIERFATNKNRCMFQSLINRLLTWDPSIRASPREVLQWMQGNKF